jgi:hypothetical protein
MVQIHFFEWCTCCRMVKGLGLGLGLGLHSLRGVQQRADMCKSYMGWW